MKTGEKIRVLVGEDSPFMRRIIVDAISREKDMEVVSAVADGKEVLRKAVELKPDCITLDLEMPRMDGLEVLRYLMGEWPTPVVVVSAHTSNGAQLTMKCLEYGAVDFVPKGNLATPFPTDELIRKVRIAASVDVEKIRYYPPDVSLVTKGERIHRSKADVCVVIGASTGGPNALSHVLNKLPEGIKACILIIQHMPPNFTRYLADRLSFVSPFSVKEADYGDGLEEGTVLVAPGGMHLFVEGKYGVPSVMLLERNRDSRSPCPSIDYAMTTASRVFGENLIGVVMTGMGNDGVAGAMAIKRAGGKIICQDEGTSLVNGMPGSVVREGLADEVVALNSIPSTIERFVEEVVSARR